MQPRAHDSGTFLVDIMHCKLPAGPLGAAAELIDWYRVRWEIEIFFPVLENACQVEALQLGQIKKIELRPGGRIYAIDP